MKGNSFLFIIFLGLIIRLALAFSTFHPDIVAFHLGGKIVADGNIFNLYDYIGNLPPDHPLTRFFPSNLLIYPPFAYLFFGFFSNTFSSLFPVYISENVIYNLPSILGDLWFNIWLVIFKSSYLVFDLAIALILSGFFNKSRNKFLAFSFWFFNPVNLYVTYMMGQFDIIPTFFVVFGLYLVKKRFSSKNLYLASFLMGVGALFKVYPLLFIIPLSFASNGWGKRVMSILIGFGVYLVSIFPFLFSPGFRSSALMAGHIFKSLYANVPISGGESIILYLAFLVFFYLVFYFKKISIKELWERFFIILLLFFIFTHYHPQWFLWITPFFVIDLILSNLRHWPLVLISLLIFFSLLFFFDPSLTIGIFLPLSPQLAEIKENSWFFDKNLNGIDIRSLFHTIFVGVGIYYIFYYLKGKDVSNL